MPVQQLELLRGQRCAVVGILAVAVSAPTECIMPVANDHANSLRHNRALGQLQRMCRLVVDKHQLLQRVPCRRGFATERCS